MDITEKITAILSQYDLGELVSFEKDERGTVNTSFATDCIRDGVDCRYFLRQYKRGIKEEELLFEHSLIRRLLAKGTPPVARVHQTWTGETYLQKSWDGEEPLFYAVFDFLGGEDRYTWVDPHCTPLEVQRSAETLAQFHASVSDFSPQGRRVEPEILDLLPRVAGLVGLAPWMGRGTVFDAHLLENLPLIQDEIDNTILVLDQPASKLMPRLVIHCDFHPGNLKFLGDEVAGVFDFDWSKIDYRSFDVALAVFYFLTHWEDSLDGSLDLELLRIFLNAYQSECRRAQAVPPLNETEFHYLPAMIQAGNLYVLNWTLLDYYNKSVDPVEYLSYLKHAVETIRWFAVPANLASLREILNLTTSP